jgi:hypothetical protein
VIVLVKIDDRRAVQALASAHSRYWIRALEIDPEALTVTAIDHACGTFTSHGKSVGGRVDAGLATFAVKCPEAFGRLMAGTNDGEDNDLFLQCTVLGEVLYG